MPCYHPKFLELQLGADGKYHSKMASGVSYHQVLNYPGYAGLMPVPCRRCIGCRIDYATDWANRCLMEMEYHNYTWFVTLTYDDEHVPVHWYSDLDTGEAHFSLSCQYRDVQLFFKRLRRAGYTYRYFGCSDYGTSTMRPHYHIILFGLSIPDLKPYYQDNPTYRYYTSDTITNIWHNGDVIIGYANRSTCLYTSKYILNKDYGAHTIYDDYHMEPPRTFMSLKPAIGRQYYDDHPGLLDTKYFHLKTADGGVRVYPPQYFRELDKLADPFTSFDNSLTNSSKIVNKIQNKLRNTDITYDELLQVEENHIINYKNNKL